MPTNPTSAIETNDFPFEHLSVIAERERHRKEIARPIYHIHKWWAQRLGSVFRGLLLGALTPAGSNVMDMFYQPVRFPDSVVFDPFMGSGTTVGEAAKLGARAVGRDINPVAVFSVRNALGRFDRAAVLREFAEIERDVSAELRSWYRTRLPSGELAEVLYYFWVMTAPCGSCGERNDLFSNRVFARHAYAGRNPLAQATCPTCGKIEGLRFDSESHTCTGCGKAFNPQEGQAQGRILRCQRCGQRSEIASAVKAHDGLPRYRVYAKLVVTGSGAKRYLSITPEDQDLFRRAATELERRQSGLPLPVAGLADGENTKQAMNYGYRTWREFFNERQLLCLGILANRIRAIEDTPLRDLFVCLFSGALEFNNMFASYKGEGTGAIRHMFSHHILKPERQPIEGNVWGTEKSSGSFATLFSSRLLPAIDYAREPFELDLRNGSTRKAYGLGDRVDRGSSSSYEDFCATGRPYVSKGDSADIDLPDASVDLVLTDPPFFDNVNYSELADFFYAWQAPILGLETATTRSDKEVQHASAEVFSDRLCRVFEGCQRVLRREGLLVFTYHHSRADGWAFLAQALARSDFQVVAFHPILSEMLAATPKRQSSEPIQIDLAVVCRPRLQMDATDGGPAQSAVAVARAQVRRLNGVGLTLGRGDIRVVLMGQGLLRAPHSRDSEAVTYIKRFASEIEPLIDDLVLEQRAPESPQQVLLAV